MGNSETSLGLLGCCVDAMSACSSDRARITRLNQSIHSPQQLQLPQQRREQREQRRRLITGAHQGKRAAAQEGIVEQVVAKK